MIWPLSTSPAKSIFLQPPHTQYHSIFNFVIPTFHDLFSLQSCTVLFLPRILHSWSDIHHSIFFLTPSNPSVLRMIIIMSCHCYCLLRHCAKQWILLTHLLLRKTNEISTIIVPFSNMRKLKVETIKKFVQGNRASRCWSCSWTLAPKGPTTTNCLNIVLLLCLCSSPLDFGLSASPTFTNSCLYFSNPSF